MNKVTVLVVVVMLIIASSVLCFTGKLPSDVISAEFAALIAWVVRGRVNGETMFVLLLVAMVAIGCPYRPVPTFTAISVGVKSECPTCTMDVVEPGVQFAVDFWISQGYLGECVEREVRKAFISCVSTPDKIPRPGTSPVAMCNAYVNLGSRWVVIACKSNPQEIFSLVIHELSHIIVWYCSPKPITDDHAYFKKMGLGH